MGQNSKKITKKHAETPKISEKTAVVENSSKNYTTIRKTCILRIVTGTLC